MIGFFSRLAYGLIAEAFCEWLESLWRWDPGPLLFEVSVNMGDAEESFRAFGEAIESVERAMLQHLEQGEEVSK